MREQTLRMLFYVVFLSQVLLISFYLPRQVLRRLRFVVDNYPPSQYPKLYPVTTDKVQRAQRNYRIMNLFALLVGFILVGVDLGWPAEEVVNWDNELILMAYLLLQFSPMIVATTGGFTYFNLKRKADSRSTRKAELRPRRLFDFVSPAVVGLAGAVYVAFVLLVLYVRQFEFPWFGGYWNIVGATAVNLLLAGVIVSSLYGKKKDPYQAYEDRARAIGVVIRTQVWVSILATIFVAIHIGLGAFDLGHLKPIATSLYFQVLTVMSFRAFRIDGVNFEVYREEPIAT